MHTRYPWKFIEVKRENQFSFTAAQEHWFPKLKKIWIMTDPDQYKVLFKPPNWHNYLIRVRNHRSKEYVKAKTTGSTDRNAHDVMLAMQLRGYTLMHTHGNVFQRGLPDILSVHPKHGIKWVEVKNEKYSFTGAQLDYLQYMKICKFPVWIIQRASELAKLNEPPNIGDFL